MFFEKFIFILVRPIMWILDIPGFTLRKKDSSNIIPRPYSYRNPTMKAVGNLKSRNWFNPANIIYGFLKTIVLSRRMRALKHLPTMLGNNKVHIVDIGAADGIHPRWEGLGKNLRLKLFEPEQAAYDVVTKLYSSDNRINCYNLAVSEYGGEIKLNIVEWPRASSVYPVNYNFMNQTSQRENYKLAEDVSLPSKKLTDIISEHECNFLKIDVEGYELPILRGSPSILSECIGLELELNFNPYIREDMPLFSDVDTFCRSNDFSLVALSMPGYMHYLLPNGRYESNGFITISDGLYLRFPHKIVEKILTGEWNKNKLSIASSIYLTFGQLEFATMLMKISLKADLLKEADELYKSVSECIRLYAGYDRLIPYRTLKSLMHWFGGSSQFNTLDY